MVDYEIRPVQAGDEKGINLLRRMPGVFENILGIPSERIKNNALFLSNMDGHVHAFVAVLKSETEETMVGMASLNVSPNPRLRHSGSVGIMVHKTYQGRGIGTAMMEKLLDMADNWLMLVRVELTVFSDNERAIHLYKKLGFKEEGVKKKAAIRMGKYEDEYLMARIRT